MFGEDVPNSRTGWLSVQFANLLGLGSGCDADDIEADDIKKEASEHAEN